jgi:proteasome beta subunit
MAVEALKDAADEDRGTGGVDLERNIFPTLMTCTVRGIETVADDEISRAYREVLEQRRRPAEA